MDDFNAYIEKNYQKFRMISDKIIKTGEAEDICHEMLIELITKPEDVKKDLIKNDQVFLYFSGMIARSQNSNSGYQRKYNKIKLELTEFIEDVSDDYQTCDDEILDCLEQAFNALELSERMMIEMKLNRTTYKDIATAFGITRKTEVKELITDSLKKIKKHVTENYRGKDRRFHV